MFSPTLLCAAGVAQQVKTWSGHDRDATIGASEIGACARMQAYRKLGTEQDPDHVEDYGALERGNAIEAWFISRIQAELQRGYDAGEHEIELIWATDEGQQTLVRGAQSVTPDGLFASTKAEIVLPSGQKVGCLLNEVKSIDPRPFEKLVKPKFNHVQQVMQGMDLVRELTDFVPSHAVITYINASFLSQQKSYYVKFDQKKADALRKRAESINYIQEGDELPDPEGYMYDTGDCDYCPFKKRCFEARSLGMPTQTSPVSKADADRVADVARNMKSRKADVDMAEELYTEAQKALVEEMSKLRTNKLQHEGVSISVWRQAAPPSVDINAMRAAGIDVDSYLRPHEPGPRVSVRIKE